MEPKTRKRIVSKGAYVSVQTHSEQTTPGIRVFGMQAGVKVMELIFCFLTISCVVLAISLFFAACLSHGTHRGGMFALTSFVFTLTALGCGKFGLVTSHKAREFMAFDLINTADLPAPDSLVRASTEPQQAQEAILLRAAAEGQETPPEQLVRPAQ